MKLDVDAIFRERLQKFLVEFIRYTHYMANGGVLFISIFLSGLLALYYRSIIAVIPPWFPIPYFLAFVIAILVARSPHRTFLLEADLLFLTPIETRMASYFKKTQVYNYFVQSLGLLLALFLLLPLYKGTMKIGEERLLFYWCVPLVLKGWNVYSSWIFLRLTDKKSQITYSLARFLYTYIVLAWILSDGHLFTYRHWQYGGFVCILPIIWFHLRLQAIKKRHFLHWYRLLEVENGLRGTFYRIVNNFTDVPSLQHQVKTRSWLNVVTKIIPYHQANTGRILFLKIFIRSSGFAGMYIRLVLLGSFLVVILPNLYAKLFAALLFLFMSVIQLKGIWGLHRKRVRYSILPLNEHQQKRSFLWVCRVLLLIQGILHGLVGLM